ncbi:gpW family head-tail joining protein [Pseudomonas aeruginosa]
MSCGTEPTLQDLEEAHRAYQALIQGNKPRVIVDQNGERVEFTAANAARLYLYIQELERKLCPAGVRRPNGPMRFVF